MRACKRTMDKRTVVTIIGIILIIAGGVFMTITEPSGAEGSDPSFGISDVSEETRPYLLQGIILVAIGIVTVLIAMVKMV